MSVAFWDYEHPTLSPVRAIGTVPHETGRTIEMLAHSVLLGGAYVVTNMTLQRAAGGPSGALCGIMSKSTAALHAGQQRG